MYRTVCVDQRRQEGKTHIAFLTFCDSAATRAPAMPPTRRRRGGVTDGEQSWNAAGASAEALKHSATRSGRHFVLLAVCAAFMSASFARIFIETYAAVDSNTASSDFDAIKAERVLKALCAGGPRVAGSPRAEQEAVYLILKELHAVRDAAEKHGATLEVETHQGSGTFYTDFLDGIVCAYQNVTSVVARLSWPAASRDALLLGAHFDSFPTSPGSSDNAVNVAAAIGVVRALASGPPQRHSILLLLNGAEESLLVAAHAFSRSHRWAADYRVVLNLEAIGAGEAASLRRGPPPTRMRSSDATTSSPHTAFDAHARPSVSLIACASLAYLLPLLPLCLHTLRALQAFL